MIYKNIEQGRFLSRPNRFIANVDINGCIHTVHVKNTGRCKELLIPGCTVYLNRSDSTARKTLYDLVAVNKNGEIINMDSQAPNEVFHEWILRKYPDATIKRETVYKDSRFDSFMILGNQKIFTEIKGVTLEENGIARFPDAPTERGIKHINGLIDAANNGFKSEIFFVIQMNNVKLFTPNYTTHPRFALALKKAKDAGVTISAYSCKVTPNSLSIDKPVKIVLNEI